MKTLCFSILLFSTYLCFAQEKATIVGEIRFGDFSKFRFRETTQIDLAPKTYNRSDTLTFKVANIYKKEKYDKPPGTEIVFEVPYEIYKHTSSSLFNKTMKMRCIFHYPTRDKNKSTTSDVLLEVDFGKIDVYNGNTVKLGEPILLTAPEKLTLTMMMNDIDEDLAVKGDNGFSETIRVLDRRFSDYYDRKEIEYPLLLDFYKLLVYTDKYVNENSFFNIEARKLNDTISNIRLQLADTTENSKLRLEQRNNLLEEYTTSTEVYQDYLRMFGRLKDYNSRLRLILFLKAR